MDNENKKAPEKNGSFKKNRRQKSKGYFIEPAQNKKEEKTQGASPEASAKKPQAQGNAEAQKNPQGDRNNNRSHHNNRRRRGNHHHAKEKAPQAAAAEQVKAPQGNAVSEEPKSAPQNHGERSHSKNHHRHGKGSFHSNNSKNEAVLRDTLGDAPEKKPAPSSVSQAPVDPADIPSDILESPISIKGTVCRVSDTDSPRVEIVGVRFKSSGKVYYFDPQGKKYPRASHAIVETARGQEYGDVAIPNTWVNESDIVPPLRPIVRAATKEDELHHIENKQKEDEAFKICNEKIAAHKLDMKLIDAQYTFDNSKLLFYFTSAGRVDFRELVKDLASVFRTRIELRQIGIRDEARIMGGLGLCGRPLCCSLFLNDFGQVSIKMAKEQNLSLNSAKISGICGRLMCCLRYEHETYEYEIKRTPPVDSLVETPDGKGTVTEINPLAATVKVRLLSTPDAPPKAFKRDELVVLKRKEPKNEEE